MKTKLTVVFLVILALWGIYDLYQDNLNSKVGINIGDKAPNIELKNLEGKTIHLSDFRGKTVIVNFWATWCTPCIEELPELKKFYKANQDKNLVILGVNVTGIEKSETGVRDFVSKHQLPYPIVLDTQNTYADLFQIKGYPTTYLINSNGIIKYKVSGQLNVKRLNEIIKEKM